MSPPAVRDRAGRSFRAALAWSFIAVLAVVVIPVLVLEVQRPWRELRALIARGDALLAGLDSAFTPEDLDRLNAFSLEMSDVIAAQPGDDSASDWGAGQAFVLFVEEGRLPTEAEVQAVFAENEVDAEGFAYDDLARWYAFWEAQLGPRPELREFLASVRQRLRDARLRGVESGFPAADVYLMLDAPGSSREIFQGNVLLVLDGLPWWEACHPGESYDLVETDTLEWRASYDRRQGGAPGFHHNRVSDPARWYMPHFDTDKWGTWFTTWLAKERPSQADGMLVGRADGMLVDTLNVDFDASVVKRMMLGAGLAIALLALVLAALVALLVGRLGASLARPIEALTAGAEAIAAGRYDHVVPPSGQAEFARLITVFNEMTGRVKESVNLKTTLTKLLSEELAEQAGKHGLVLGGREVDTTIMFTDFAGFSALTQKMKPEEMVSLLNLYFGELIPIIKRHGGFPDKFIGDAIVAIFGAPVLLPDHAERAVSCAIEMQRRVRVLNDERRSRDEIVFEMRVGLNSGPVIAGAIGCDLKLEYTSIGETTNLANRMEASCRIGQVLMTSNTYSRLGGARFDGVTIDSDPVLESVKGYDGTVSTHAAWVSDVEITKNPSAAGPADFYAYAPRKKD